MTNYGLQAYLYFLFHLWQGLIYNYQTKTNISLTGMNSFSKKKSLNLTSGSHGESQNRWAALLYYVLTIQQKLPCLEASKRFTTPPPTNSGCGECRCASACSPPECWKVILEGISEQGSSHFVHTSFLSLPVVSLPPPPSQSAGCLSAAFPSNVIIAGPFISSLLRQLRRNHPNLWNL